MQRKSFAMANVGETVAEYVGHKISKVRWMPQVQGQLNPSETFVTGGWDDQASNRVVKQRKSQRTQQFDSTRIVRLKGFSISRFIFLP